VQGDIDKGTSGLFLNCQGKFSTSCIEVYDIYLMGINWFSGPVLASLIVSSKLICPFREPEGYHDVIERYPHPKNEKSG